MTEPNADEVDVTVCSFDEPRYGNASLTRYGLRTDCPGFTSQMVCRAIGRQNFGTLYLAETEEGCLRHLDLLGAARQTSVLANDIQ